MPGARIGMRSPVTGSTDPVEDAMPAYLIVQIDAPSDRAALASYRDAVGPCAAAFGGQYIVAGGVKVDVLEGMRDNRSLVIFEFPSMDAIQEFWRSPRYAQVKKLREGIGRFEVWAVPGYVPGYVPRQA